MTEHTEAQLEERVDELLVEAIFGLEADDCMAHTHCQEAIALWRDRILKTATPIIQAQVLRDMYESTKADYLISPSPRPADFVKKHAKETYGIEL